MGAVSYPESKTSDFIRNNFVPVQLKYDAKPESDIYNVRWTPTILILDWDGHEHHRSMGFLPPDDFVPELMLGLGKTGFDYDSFDLAIDCFNRILEEYPHSKVAPEAFYMRGVSLYKKTEDAKPLKEAYEGLHDRYPGSEWAEKAAPYRLL